MKYERISKGVFLERPNRFIAYAELAGKKEDLQRASYKLKERKEFTLRKSQIVSTLLW